MSDNVRAAQISNAAVAVCASHICQIMAYRVQTETFNIKLTISLKITTFTAVIIRVNPENVAVISRKHCARIKCKTYGPISRVKTFSLAKRMLNRIYLKKKRRNKAQHTRMNAWAHKVLASVTRTNGSTDPIIPR